MVVYQESTPPRGRPWLILALVVSAAFWLAVGTLALVLTGQL